jgi:abortive infection bacteriophage resistance protein
MSSHEFDFHFGSKRRTEYQHPLEGIAKEAFIRLFLFDLKLRALIIKAMSLIELSIQVKVLRYRPAIVIQSFGQLRREISDLPSGLQHLIAKEVGVGNPKQLRALLRNFNTLRNCAAHHERVWNKRLPFAIPKITESIYPTLGSQSLDRYSSAASLLGIMHFLTALPYLFDFEREFDQLIEETDFDRDFLLKSMGFEVS